MPDIYISRAGMETKQLDEKFTQTELSELKDELAKVNLAARIKEERMEQAMQNMRVELLETVNQIMQKNPTIKQVEAALEHKNNLNKNQNKP